jgi:hypothetical protein
MNSLTKNGQMTLLDVSLKKTYKWPTGIWKKMLIVTNHQENANLNYNDIAQCVKEETTELPDPLLHYLQ